MPKSFPHFRQGDSRWGKRQLGPGGATIAKSGCVVTATAMALSKATERRITPKAVDIYLDTYDGYVNDSMKWHVAAEIANMNVAWVSGGLEGLDEALAEKYAVIVGVDYKAGSEGGPNNTDHWLLVHKKKYSKYGVYYWAVDPMTGKDITLRPQKDGSLKARNAKHRYVTTGEMRWFSRL